MPLYDTSIPQNPYSAYNAGVVPNDVHGVAINWFVNRTPLWTRLAKAPLGSPHFLITNDNFRPSSIALQTSLADGSGTSVVVSDSTIFVAGDVVEIETEQMLITSIVYGTNTLTVTRGYAGTTGVAHATPLSVYLIGNTRTGAEVDVNGISRIPSAVTQYAQTVQHVCQIGGALEGTQNYVSGLGSPLQRERILCMQHCADDFERSCYYGGGVALGSSTARPQMRGLRGLISTNRTLAPTNAAAYKPSDLVRDTVQKCFDNGGNPTLILASTDFLSGLAVWGGAIQRVDAGSNIFGTPIDLIRLPFVAGVHMIPAPLLRPGTAICVADSEIRVRMKRALAEKPRGSRGDAYESDFIMEGAIELDNEAHHAWVSGVTAFAAA